MVSIIDYGCGNVSSVRNMLKKIGIQSVVTNCEDEILKSNHIILPGVGAYDDAIKNIINLNLWDTLNYKKNDPNCNILGICLGFQLFCNSSQEGKLNGFKWLNAEVLKFEGAEMRIPNIGWNHITVNNKQLSIINELKFYFVHSFYVENNDADTISGYTDYLNVKFSSLIKKDNILGVQFHPEKSHKYGMKFFENYFKYLVN